METTATITNPTRDKAADYTLLAAFVLGVAGDILLWRAGPIGPGLSVWVALLSAAALILNRDAESAWRNALVIWSCVAVAATLILVFRGTEVLIPLALLVLVLCAAAVLLQARGKHPGAAQVTDYLRSTLQLPAQVLLGSMATVAKVPLGDALISGRTRGILRGVVMVIPLLLLFIGLFSSADATFERYASRLGDVLSLDTPKHILIVLMTGWVATGLLTCTLQQKHLARARQQSPRVLGDEETAVIMGTLLVLFLVFVGLQTRYLFGGREMIEASSGLTLAAYARRGFFELIAVSALTLTVLLVMSAVQCKQRIFRPLALALVVCVLLILVSAAQRLSLYTDAFGLTLSRVMAMACMAWLACNLLTFAATVLRGRSHGFGAGFVMSGIAAIILLGAVNPAAVVAQVNLDRMMQDGRNLDVHYLSRLGADVVPILLENFEALSHSDQCQVAADLYSRWHPVNDPEDRQGLQDWRSWNASKARARQLVLEHESVLMVACLADRHDQRYNPAL